MSEDETGCWSFGFFVVLILISAITVAGDSLDTDRKALLNLKSFLEKNNPVNQGKYAIWNSESSNPCQWPGVLCTRDRTRVTGIDLGESNISGELFGNFSALSQLEYLNLSSNTISGLIPQDLNKCQRLRHLNLSHNILQGELKLTGLMNLEVLDLSLNRIWGEIQFSFPSICNRLVVANLSTNNFTGQIDNCFDACQRLKYLDLSSNKFTGVIWAGFGRLLEFSVSENFLGGSISGTVFRGNCTLQILGLSENNFTGEFPGDVANCQHLIILNLWGNRFTGRIPHEIGSVSTLEGLYLGNNSFSRDIPESLLNLSNLVFLDLSMNGFKGDIQEIFGRFTQVKFLVLHSNWYTGGIYSSGILKLGNVSRLDLSYNNFSGALPVEFSQMQSLKFLILAYNQFNGTIAPEYGSMTWLQALDLSFNRLSGSIPISLGNLSSLLWLMLANNSLNGEIPRELGNCTSLLWLNMANNNLSGRIPNELVNVGSNPTPTFELNQRSTERIIPGSGECLAMKRWIPADYPPFKFAYALLTRKHCRSIWDRVLKGIGLFQVSQGSKVRTFQVSGYLQLCGNKLYGELPKDINKMRHLSMLHLGFNNLSGKLPVQIGDLQVVVLNLTQNNFSGEIPADIRNLKCLQNLDLSYNNFSGNFPAGLNELNELSKFNISYNPFISGIIPSTGQLATFDNSSFLGNPHLHLPSFLNNSAEQPGNKASDREFRKRSPTVATLFVILALSLSLLVCFIFSLIIFMLVKNSHEAKSLLEGSKFGHDAPSSSGAPSSLWLCRTVKVISLDKTRFTYADLLKATSNFSEERVIGKGGFGIVYRGLLPDGRQVAIKKLQRNGTEGEREFRAEMEVLRGEGLGHWPHPNLVALYGWCLHSSEKILVYEYMEGGSLEELISDKTKLPWRRRIEISIDVARALLFLHHECFPSIVHRDVKASNVLLDRNGNARVTDFGLARVVDAGDSHVSTIIAGTVGYVAPEYGQTWQATTRGDVYSFGVLTMELATGRRAVDGGEECLVEWAKRLMRIDQGLESPAKVLGLEGEDGAEKMAELVQVGMKCTAEQPQARPNMKDVLAMLLKISGKKGEFCNGLVPPSEDWIKD